MTEHKFKLTGWKAIVGLAVLVAVFGARLVTFRDKTGDRALMRQVEVLLMSDYFPGEAARLRAVVEGGDAAEVERVAKSVTTAKVNVESVQASYPLFDLSTPKDVVVKVVYSLKDASGTRGRKTKYYLFRHGSLGNIWTYEYETGVIAYYLNFQ
jgi:hypothetical protein